MSRLQFLNVFLTERLTAVAMEISVVLEQHLGEYQEEISRSNEENKRLQSLLDLVFSSEIKLQREDSQQLSLLVSEEAVPPEQQHCEEESSPSLGQEDPEPTQIKGEQEDLRTSQEEEQPQGLEPDTKDLLIPACVKSDYEQDPSLPSHLDQTLENRERDSQPTNTTEQIKTEPDGEDYRVSEPTRDSQLLSAVNPECSAAQSENGKVHQSPSTSSEQDSSNVESNKASNFCNWSDENISVTDSNSSDSSSCTKEDSEARKPAKRTCHSSGVLNEPSDLSNLCDENNPGTEISPSDGNKDMNIQTDSGSHNPAKRICQRVHSVAVARRGSGEMASCSHPKVPGSTPDYTHCMHCQGPQPTPVTQAPGQPTRCTRTQPIPVAVAPGQPTRRTRAQPTRLTRAQPTRRTRAQPTRRTRAQPTRLTGAQPTRRTGAQPSRRTGAQPSRRTGAQPSRRTGAQPSRRTGTQPTRRNAVRLKWIIDEVAAVEKHMMPFLERVAEFLERGTASNASSQNLWRSNTETG